MGQSELHMSHTDDLADNSSHENNVNLLSWPKMRLYAALISFYEPKTLGSI